MRTRHVGQPVSEAVLTDMAARIVAEALNAKEIYGPYQSPHEGYGVILEELEELWEGVRANNHVAAAYEAVQVAATALRFACEYGPDLPE